MESDRPFCGSTREAVGASSAAATRWGDGASPPTVHSGVRPSPSRPEAAPASRSLEGAASTVDPVDAARSFQGLVAALSAAGPGDGPEALERQVRLALRGLATLLDADHLSLVEWAPAEGEDAVSRCWAWARGAATPERFDGRGPFPWYVGRLQGGATVMVAAGDLPGRAGAPALESARWLVPVWVRGSRICAIAAGLAPAAGTGSQEQLERIQIVGSMVAASLYLSHVEDALHRTRVEVQRLRGHLEAENAYLREEMDLVAGFEHLVGRSPALRRVVEQAAQVAPTSISVLLLGETGTGKELVARAIHARSPGRGRALVKVNCAALPPSLVESELFGHEKGAFTGATSARPGRFELAEGGTIFLDEIGEVPPDVQVKLLRVLQDGEFERLGSTRTRKAHVRLIAATNRDLERAIEEGRFREDLYYRLSAFPIRLPPLRERREDIPLLVWNFIQRRQDGLGRRIGHIPDAAMEALASYPWPGNIRELGNVIERALVLSRGGVLELDAGFGGSARGRLAPAQRLADVERAHILRILEGCGWTINGRGNAAEILGLHPNTLRSRLKKLGLVRPTGSIGLPCGRESGSPGTISPRSGSPFEVHDIG